MRRKPLASSFVPLPCETPQNALCEIGEAPAKVGQADEKTPFHDGATPVFNQVMSHVEFDSVVTAHHEEILRYLRRVIGPVGDAEDLSQETFLRAYRAYGSLSKDANVRAWLFSIATNLAKNHFRSETRRRRAYGEAETAGRETTQAASEAELAARETGTLVERIVQSLPLKQRLAFTQRKLHDMDYEAIGKSLGCSSESARAHVFQALRKIRQGLASLGPC